MNPEADITLPALKFLTSESKHVCRLCFSLTEEQEVSFEDDLRLQRSYFDETVTFVDMFHKLGVHLEPSLPQVLCMNCATMTINSYLFQKLCQNSNEKWNTVLNGLNASLDQSMSIGSQVQTVYFLIKENENQMFTSRKHHTLRSKKNALKDIRKVLYAKKRRKKQNSNIVCEECGQRFNANYYLAKHIMKSHSKINHPCSECPKIFATQPQLDEHSERMHQPKKIQCPKCPKMLSTNKMLSMHDKLHHVAAVCRRCFVEFPSRKELKVHADKHDINKCPHCDKLFLNRRTFRLHSRICGVVEEMLPSFICDICRKDYTDKNYLRTHLKMDHGFGKVHSCKWCGKKFDSKSRLKSHIVTHTKERNFRCDHCGGKFVTQAALVYHTRLHTGERPFPCDLCSESFLSASRRMEHKRRKHIGPTRECHLCPAKFIAGHQLRKHIQRHFNPQSKLFLPKTEL